MIKDNSLLRAIAIMGFILVVFSTYLVIYVANGIYGLSDNSLVDKTKLYGRYDCIGGELYKVDSLGHKSQVWQTDTTSLPCWIIIEK